MRNIVLSFFVVAINDALTEKAWEDVVQRLCKVILTKLWTTRPIGCLVSELDACNTTSCRVVWNILTIEFSFFFLHRKRSLLQKEFAMTTADVVLSSTALRNDPYRRLGNYIGCVRSGKPWEQRLHFRCVSWRAKSSLCRQPFNFLSCMREIRHTIRKQN